MPYGYQQYGSGLMGMQPGFEGLFSGLGQRAQQRLNPEYRQQLFQYPEDYWNYDRGGWLPGTPLQLRMGMTPMPQQPIPLGQGGALPENMQFQNNPDPFLQRFMQMLMNPQGTQQQLPGKREGGAVEEDDKIQNPVEELIAMIKAEREGTPHEIPMVLHEGEYILNPEAVAALGGPQALDRVNEQAIAAPMEMAAPSPNQQVPNIPFFGQMARDLMANQGPQQGPQQEMMPPYMGRPNRPPQPQSTAGSQVPFYQNPAVLDPNYQSMSPERAATIEASRPPSGASGSYETPQNRGALPLPPQPDPHWPLRGLKDIGSDDVIQTFVTWVSQNSLGEYGHDWRFSDIPQEGWELVEDAPPLEGAWRAYRKAASPSTPQNIGGDDEAVVTAPALVDPLTVVEETAPITSYQKRKQRTKPEAAALGVAAPATSETATPAPALSDMPATEFRQHHQPFGLDQDYIKNASPEDVMVYLEAVARNRAPSAILSSQRRLMDPSVQQLPPSEVMLNQMVTQYAGVKLTPETIRDAQLTNDFNEDTQQARADLITGEARRVMVAADIDEDTKAAEILRLEAVAQYTQAQARSLNMETDFLSANKPGQQVLFDYSVEQAGWTNDLYKDMADWSLKELQASTALALAQAAAYSAEGSALDTIIADPQAYADLIESSQQLRDDRIRTVNQTNQELRSSLDGTGLNVAQKQQIEAEIFRNTFLVQWLTTPGAMEGTTLEGLAAEHTGGNVDKLINRFGWESTDDFAKLKARAAEILAGLDLVGQVLPGMTAFSGSGGATPMPQGGQPAAASGLPYGGGAMQSGGQGGTDALALYALSVGMQPEQLMQMLQAASQGGP